MYVKPKTKERIVNSYNIKLKKLSKKLGITKKWSNQKREMKSQTIK